MFVFFSIFKPKQKLSHVNLPSVPPTNAIKKKKLDSLSKCLVSLAGDEWASDPELIMMNVKIMRSVFASLKTVPMLFKICLYKFCSIKGFSIYSNILVHLTNCVLFNRDKQKALCPLNIFSFFKSLG